MGPNAALHCREILNNLSTIVAIELFCAAQALDFRLQKQPEGRLGEFTRQAYAHIRQEVPFIQQDTLLHPHLEKLLARVRAGEFAALTPGLG
jgi:histidine ammonia-lyase